MLTRTVAVPTSASSLADLLDRVSERMEAVALQAPATNAANVFFGDLGTQSAFIPPGSSTDILPIKSTRGIGIKGTSGDNLIVVLF